MRRKRAIYSTKSKSKKAKKDAVVKIDDNENELDSLVEEFVATVESNSDEKNTAQSKSDNVIDFEIDEVLTEFAENEKEDNEDDDDDYEFDSLLEEFAQSECEEGLKTKPKSRKKSKKKT